MRRFLLVVSLVIGCRSGESGRKRPIDPAVASREAPTSGSPSSTAAAGASARAPLSCRPVEGDGGPAGVVPVRAETVVAGLEVPWSIAFLPGGDWLVTERPGRIRLVRRGKLEANPVARLDVESPAEGGLLGLALDPAFEQSGRFFVTYSMLKNGEPVNRVARWKLAADHGSASEETVLLDDIPGSRYHDGGRLRVGPDRMLYVGTGDGQKPERAQDVASPNGKILRLTLEGRVPDDNPWPGRAAYVVGLRNVEAFDFAPGGAIYIADHGPSGELGRRGHDEIDVAHKGENLGWPVVYGCETQPSMIAPVLTWDDAVPPGGAAIYTGRSIPEWRGSFLVGTLKSKQLLRIFFEEGKVRHEVYFHGDPPQGLGRMRDVVMGPDGFLYATTSNCDGRGTCPEDKDRVVRITL